MSDISSRISALIERIPSNTGKLGEDVVAVLKEALTTIEFNRGWAIEADEKCHAAEQRANLAEAEIKRLTAFKAYVHERLDQAGVPADPPGEHRDAGCRIGQRLDVLIGARDRAELEVGGLTLDRSTLVNLQQRVREDTDRMIMKEVQRTDRAEAEVARLRAALHESLETLTAAKDAFVDMRDCVLNERGPLEAAGASSEVITSVLAIMDDEWPDDRVRAALAQEPAHASAPREGRPADRSHAGVADGDARAVDDGQRPAGDAIRAGMEEPPAPLAVKPIRVGDRVRKRAGFRFPGVVVAMFSTTAGKQRCVVEAEHEEYAGMLHIYDPSMLVPAENP